MPVTITFDADPWTPYSFDRPEDIPDGFGIGKPDATLRIRSSGGNDVRAIFLKMGCRVQNIHITGETPETVVVVSSFMEAVRIFGIQSCRLLVQRAGLAISCDMLELIDVTIESHDEDETVVLDILANKMHVENTSCTNKLYIRRLPVIYTGDELEAPAYTTGVSAGMLVMPEVLHTATRGTLRVMHTMIMGYPCRVLHNVRSGEVIVTIGCTHIHVMRGELTPDAMDVFVKKLSRQDRVRLLIDDVRAFVEFINVWTGINEG